MLEAMYCITVPEWSCIFRTWCRFIKMCYRRINIKKKMFMWSNQMRSDRLKNWNVRVYTKYLKKLGTDHLTWRGGVCLFVSFRIFSSDNARVRILFFFQNLTLGYMTKTLNQIIFFSSTKIRLFFSATLRIRIFF